MKAKSIAEWIQTRREMMHQIEPIIDARLYRDTKSQKVLKHLQEADRAHTSFFVRPRFSTAGAIAKRLVKSSEINCPSGWSCMRLISVATWWGLVAILQSGKLDRVVARCLDRESQLVPGIDTIGLMERPLLSTFASPYNLGKWAPTVR